MISINEACQSDLADVARLCFKGLEERGIDFDENAVVGFLMETWRYAPTYIAQDGDNMVGMFGLSLGRKWWSNEPILEETMVYVLPEFRNCDILSLLCEEAKRFADFHGLPLHLSYVGSGSLEARSRLASRMKFTIDGYMLSYKGENNGKEI